ncbi:MAG: lysophospholipase [Lachnospiraceae bacterium]|nr:lysophospholipase [Lachnospiraceae bacterium]
MREEIFLQSTDGETKLHGFVWKPDGEVKCVLQLVHGMVEYIARYDAFAEYLSENGIAVIGHDHLGHGQSVTGEDKLGYFAHEDGAGKLIEDMRLVTEEGKKRYPDVPHFILGHSMGSFLVRRYLSLYSEDVNGAIIMGTGFIPAPIAFVGKTVAKIDRKFKGEFHRSKTLTALALGSNNKPFEPARTPVDWLSRNEENVDRYMADPLCGYLFTTSAFVDFFTFIGEDAKKKNVEAIRKDLPILITSGELDPVGGKKACESLYGQYLKAGLKNVRLKLYPEDRHEILNEVDRKTVYKDLKAWLEMNEGVKKEYEF